LQKTDMHPVDLIRDSSMLVRQKFKFNGVPDMPLIYPEVPKQVCKAAAKSNEGFKRMGNCFHLFNPASCGRWLPGKS